MHTIHPAIPVLHPITFTDWLGKLGNKALLSWLELHSWKTEQNRDDQPYCLRISLNQLIKKLKVGKSTFYKSILDPLIQYGLITLKRTEKANRETHLVLFSFPQNCLEKALLPLAPITAELVVLEETSTLVSDTPTPYRSSPPETTEEQTCLPNEKTQVVLPMLPIELSESISTDPKAHELLPDILTVYEKVHTHPVYNPTSFLHKLTTCLKYSRNKHTFASYFHKSLLNEWDKQANVPLKHTPISTCPQDIPPWIREQDQRKVQSVHVPLSKE